MPSGEGAFRSAHVCAPCCISLSLSPPPAPFVAPACAAASVSVSRSPPPAAGAAPPPVGRHVLYLAARTLFFAPPRLASNHTSADRDGTRSIVFWRPSCSSRNARAARHDCSRVIAPTDCLKKGKCALNIFNFITTSAVRNNADFHNIFIIQSAMVNKTMPGLGHTIFKWIKIAILNVETFSFYC